MAISHGFWPLFFSVESLVLREIVPNIKSILRKIVSKDCHEKIVKNLKIQNRCFLDLV
jgi:hypothetical protein